MAPPLLERVFGLAQRGTTVGREALAGATTFVTMAYVLVVNPQILSAVADPTGHTPSQAALLTSTALVAAASTLAMGLLANLPLALAPGMGLNSFLAFQLVAARGFTWREAMGVIVAEGLVITILVLTGLRQAVVRAVPASLKRAIGVGIGLFLAFIGLVNAGFVTRSPAGPVPVQLGDGGLHGFPPLLFALTLLVTAWLLARKTTGALLVGMAIATVLAVVARTAGAPGFAPEVAVLPRSPIALPDFGQVGQFDLGFVRQVGWLTGGLLVFSLMLSDFFDTVGTVVAVGHEAKYLDARGGFPRPGTVLLIDSLAAAAGGAVGASSATTYVESAAGAAAGGRTGLANVMTALLFGLSLFLAPLAQVVPPQATGAVLVLVGFLMVRDVGELPWSDPTEAIPAFLTVTLMPFTYSITNGIGAGFISYCVLKALRGGGRTLHPLLLGAAAAFVVYFTLG